MVGDGRYGEARDVVEGEEADLVAHTADSGIGFCEDVAAGAAAFAAAGFEGCCDRPEVGMEAGIVVERVSEALLGGGCFLKAERFHFLEELFFA